MRFTWRDCTEDDIALIDSWLDEPARYFTGCTDGWLDYINYWRGDSQTRPGENFWVKIAGAPEYGDFAVMALFYMDEDVLSIAEIIIAPEKRSLGLGTAVLCELLRFSTRIIGIPVTKAAASIFPSNEASVRAFEKAGFRYRSTHPDGDIAFYEFNKQ